MKETIKNKMKILIKNIADDRLSFRDPNLNPAFNLDPKTPMNNQSPTRLRVAIFAAICATALLLGAHRTLAQANANPPPFMTYQGYLVDGNGNPLGTNAPKNYDVIFRIWDSASGGATPLWAEQQTVTVDKGYFSVLLGEGSSIGEPRPALNTVFTNNTASDRWVGITVKAIGPGGADANILPRLRLMTAPYAFLAQKVVAVDGSTVSSGTVSDSRLSANVALRNGGNTFSGDQIFTAADFRWDNARTWYAKTASGTYEMFLQPRWSDNVTYLNYGSSGFNIRNSGGNSRMFITSSGNVGIGTASPSSKLHIVDTAIPSALIESSSAVGTWIALRNTSTGGRYWHFISSGSGNGGGAGKLLITSGTGPGSTDANPVAISSDGKVGVNTLSPATSLHVVGGNAGQLRLQNSQNSHYWNIFTESIPNSGHLLFASDEPGVHGGWIDRVTGSYNQQSDAQVKKDVAPLDGQLDRVMQLRPVSYRFKSQENDDSKSLGFIAQEVEPIYPEVVSESQGLKGLAYSELVPVTVAAIQEINKKLESQLAAKEDELRRLQSRIAELEQQQKDRDSRMFEWEKLLRKQLGLEKTGDDLRSELPAGN